MEGEDDDAAVTLLDHNSQSRSSSASRRPHRVRFDLRPTVVEPRRISGMRVADDSGDGDDEDDSSRRPLLAGVAAPAIVLAQGGKDIEYEDEAEMEEARGDAAETVDRHDADGEGGGGLLAQARHEMLRPRSGMAAAFVNMANSILGAGIVGQSYALRQAGLAAGLALLVLLAVVVDWTIVLIVVNTKLAGRPTFQAAVEVALGRPGHFAVSLAQGLFAFGGMVAYAVIVGDSIPPVLRAAGLAHVPVLGWLTDRRVAIVVCVSVVSYPLSLYRDISKLAKASMLALLSMVVIITAVVVEGIRAPAVDRGPIPPSMLGINGGFFQAIGVISFAYVCQHNSLLIYGSLHTPTLDRFARVTHLSTSVSAVACLAMALAGFLAFGERTQGNVLNNLPAAGDGLAAVARLCFGLNMLTTLPLEAFVCREVLLGHLRRPAAGHGHGHGPPPFRLALHVAVTTALVAAAVLIALSTCDLGAVFELVGATSACALAYILPPLCYVRLAARSWRTYVAYAVFAFGCVVMVISVIQALIKIATGYDTVTCS